MVEILRNKNLATKFQIMAEIANGGPYIQQRNIAGNLGITPQAVSDYIKQLTQDGLISLEEHSGHRLTAQGVNWIIQELRSLREYSDFVVKSITGLSVCAAIAESALKKAQRVGLVMKDGLLWATPDVGKTATGITCSSAAAGEDVGVQDIRGLVALVTGKVTLFTVPPVQKGGSCHVDLQKLKKHLKGKEPVCALGIEALVALRKVHPGEIGFFGAVGIVIEAAQHGLSPLIVCVENEMAALISRLEENHIEYTVIDMGASQT